MKIGIECEGLYQGLKTLFCDASEVSQALSLIYSSNVQHRIVALYVSDHLNSLTLTDYQSLSASCMCVTVEVLKLPDAPRFPNINYMLAVLINPASLGLFDTTFTRSDQIKLTGDMYVACTTIKDMVLTLPSAFDGDVTL